jgi:hypothetical protein
MSTRRLWIDVRTVAQQQQQQWHVHQRLGVVPAYARQQVVQQRANL